MKKRNIVTILTAFFSFLYLFAESSGDWTTMRIKDSDMSRQVIKHCVRQISQQKAGGFYVLIDSGYSNNVIDRKYRSKLQETMRYILTRAKKANLQVGVRISDWEQVIPNIYDSIEPCGRIVISEAVGTGKELFGPDRRTRGHVPIDINFIMNTDGLSYTDIALLCFPANYRRSGIVSDIEMSRHYIPSEAIADFTGSLDGNGDSIVSVTLPRGEWRLVRIGYVVDPEVFPVNRLDKDATYLVAERWFSGFLNMVGKKRYDGVVTRAVIDFAFGHSRIWTRSFKEEFEVRRGYELTSSDLLLYAGYSIQDKERTDKLTSDIFSTLMEIVESNYYVVFDSVAAEYGCELFLNTVWTRSFKPGSEWSPRSLKKEREK